MIKPINQADIAHILRSVSAITKCKEFILVGSGAVIAGRKSVPESMAMTPEIDLYAKKSNLSEQEFCDLVDGTVGQYSQFATTFGYYADPVSSKTASMPKDWRSRARTITLTSSPDIKITVPSSNDIAMAKLVAWRDKDKDWLIDAKQAGIIDPNRMASFAENVSDPRANPDEIRRRINWIDKHIPPPGKAISHRRPNAKGRGGIGD